VKRTCNCQEKILVQLKERYKADDAVLDEVNLFSGQTFANAALIFNGKRRKKTVFVVHEFCPWCGVAYTRTSVKKNLIPRKDTRSHETRNRMGY
jgi:hypothetical protein